MGPEGPQFGACGSSHLLASIDKLSLALQEVILCNSIQSDSYVLSVKLISMYISVLILRPKLQAAKCFFGSGVGHFPAHLDNVV